MRLMRAHIFSRPSSLSTVSFWPSNGIQVDGNREAQNVLGFAHAADQLVPAVAHNGAHAEEEDTGTETLGGEVSLGRVSLVVRDVIPCFHSPHLVRSRVES